MTAEPVTAEQGPAKHLLKADDLDPAALDGLLELALRLASGPVQRQDRMLPGKTAVIAPGEAPLANRIAMEAALRQLGGHPLAITPPPLQTPRDAAELLRALDSQVDLLALGSPDGSDDLPATPFAAGPTHCLHLGGGGTDPLEALAALATLQRGKRTPWDQRRLVIAHCHPADACAPQAGSPGAANTLLRWARMLGVDVTLFQSDTLDAPWDPGAADRLVTEPLQAVGDADAVYPWCPPQTGRGRPVDSTVDEPWTSKVTPSQWLRTIHGDGADRLAPARLPTAKAVLLHLLG